MTINERMHWREVAFEDGETVNSLILGGDGETAAQRAVLLNDYRLRGEIEGMFLAPVAGQSVSAENAHLAGPRPSQIAWDDIEQVLRTLVQYDGAGRPVGWR